MRQASYSLKFDDPADTVYALAASPAGACFAACNSGLYRSLDGGLSWARMQLPQEQLTTAVAVSPDFASDRSVFAAVKGGILRSSDGGDTWFTTAFPAPPPVFSSLVVSPAFERDGILLAGTLEDGVFSSEDCSVHWQPWNFGLFDLHVLCLALSPNWLADETAFAGADTGLYRSGNGGRAWRVTDFPAELAPVLCLAIVGGAEPGEAMLLAGTEENGLLASEDEGRNWRPLASDCIKSAVNQLQAVKDAAGHSALFALVEDAVLRSMDGGCSWEIALRAEGAATAMLVHDGVILMGVQGRGILRRPID